MQNPRYRVTAVKCPSLETKWHTKLKTTRVILTILELNNQDTDAFMAEIANQLPYVLMDGVSEEKADSVIKELATIDIEAEKAPSDCPNPLIAHPSINTIYEWSLLWGRRKK